MTPFERYVASIGLPIISQSLTFHQSPPPFDALRLIRASLSLLTNHFPVRHSPATAGRRRITSHGRASGPAAALRLSVSGSVNAKSGCSLIYDKVMATWRSNSGSQ